MGPLTIEARGLTLHHGGRAAGRRRPSVRGRRSSIRGRQPPVRGIDAIDLAVAPGTIVGLLGPNGAGKSTLLRVLATVLRPTAGTLRLLGADVRPPLEPLRRRIGFADHRPVHFAPLSGTENVVFFARAAGLPRARAKREAAALLARLGLADDAGRRAGEYSAGMRRKLLLAETLVHAPDLVLLDEPTVGLDPPSVESLRSLLRDRAAAGAAVVLATHDVAEAARLCDRVVFLDRGRVVVEGAPDELIRRVGQGTRIEIRFAARPDELALDDVDILRADPDHVALLSRRGTEVLPSICAALLDKGADIRSIGIREPDLRDVFTAATGSDWEPPEPASEPGSESREARP